MILFKVGNGKRWHILHNTKDDMIYQAYCSLREWQPATVTPRQDVLSTFTLCKTCQDNYQERQAKS